MGGAIGHNRGPALDVATGWKTHCWRQAREALLPTLPVEVVRLRVKRAKELGLPYQTYAGIRAQTGHDVVAFLFSSNALKAGPLSPMLPAPIAAKLAGLTDVARIGLASAPLSPSALALNPDLDRAHAAPDALASFPLTARTYGPRWGRCLRTGWFWSALVRWSATGVQPDGWRLSCPARNTFAHDSLSGSLWPSGPRRAMG